MRKVLALGVFLLILAAGAAFATSVVCDNCGRTFDVPQGMYNFKCPYCGYEYDSWHCSVCNAINYVPLAWNSYT
jgi:predicted RNA-binding Zn-ribbon protein involved in translation (DUF1610 family)